MAARYDFDYLNPSHWTILANFFQNDPLMVDFRSLTCPMQQGLDNRLWARWNPQNNQSDLGFMYNIVDPNFYVWSTDREVQEIELNGFKWSALDQVSAEKYRIWERMSAYGVIDFNKANVRNGVTDFCKKANGDPVTALLNSITPYMRQPARGIEYIFCTGTGTYDNPATVRVTHLSPCDCQRVACNPHY